MFVFLVRFLKRKKNIYDECVREIKFYKVVCYY